MADTNGTTTGPSATPNAGMPLHIMAALQSRAALSQRLGTLFDGRRDMHQLLGYKQQLQYQDFAARYRRQHLAHPAIRIFPEATWAQPPSIDEDNQANDDTRFEAAWKALEQRLRVFQLLERTDVLANLGQYAVLLIGLRGQSQLELPASPVASIDDILYLTPYSEQFATISQLEMNPGVSTFGQPLYYTLHFGRGSTLSASSPIGHRLTGRVHASRVLHVAEDVLDDEVYGVPRLEPIFDLLDDMYKVEGGGSEMWWTDSKRRLVFAMRDDFTMSTEDTEALKEEVEEFTHELRNFVRVRGIDVSAIAGSIQSPKDHIDVIMTLIAATLRIPRRVLEGSERGALASSQDEAGWLQRVQRRQVQFAEQRMLRPLLDRLIALQALPTPAKPYTVSWDNLLSLSEDQQATVAQHVGQALNAYAPGMASAIVPPEEFRSVYMGLKEVPDFDVSDVAPAPEEL